MDESDKDWIENNLNDPLTEEKSIFKGTLFLSTDGKHTVSVEADTPEGRRAALKWANTVYRRLLVTYGTKQKQVIEQYKGSSFDKTSAVEHSMLSQTPSSICPIHQVQMRQYEKNDAKWYSHKVGDIWCNPFKKK